jgi:GNAT superfamily N-acetyltransferase
MSSLAAADHEDLEDGHRPTTPFGDNLLLDFARGHADAFGATVGAGGGRVSADVDHGIHLCDLGIGSPFGNVALVDQPVPDRSVAEVAARVQAFFAEAAGGPYLVFSPWPLDLSAHGFVRVGHPPLMLRPAGGEAPVVVRTHVEEVTDAEQLAVFEQTLVEAYPAPEMLPWRRGSFFAPAVLDTGWRLFVGYGDGVPVATAGAFVTATTTLVELVSTRPEARGKGHGTAVTAAATLTAPDRPAMLISSDLGRPIYDRLGYLPLLRYSLWLGMR